MIGILKLWNHVMDLSVVLSLTKERLDIEVLNMDHYLNGIISLNISILP